MNATPAISAWTWAGSEAAQREVVARAVELDLARLNVMVNGLGTIMDDPHDFYLNSAGQTLWRFLRIATEAGIVLDVTTWVTRSPTFIREAAEALVPLLDTIRTYQRHHFPDLPDDQLCRLCFDVEDTWYESRRMARVKGLLDAEDAADLVVERFGPVLEWTVGSSIGYVPKSAAVLIDRLMRAEVQAYSLSVTPLALFRRWWKRFATCVVDTIALRAYRITETQMRAAWLSAEKAGATEVTYWDARSLTSRQRATRKRIDSFFAWVRKRRSKAVTLAVAA